MEEKKISELNDEALDAATGGARPYDENWYRSAIDTSGMDEDDMSRMDDGPIKWCETCKKSVKSKVSFYGNMFFCPKCTNRI